MQLGDWTIHSLCDGYVDIDQAMLFDQSAPVIQKRLGSEETLYQTPIYAFLIDTGQHLILVDTGCGGILGPTAGQLMERLKEIGCDALNVTHVLITHLHLDHIGGLLDEQGERVFPQATLYVPKADADFWTDSDEEAKAIDLLRPNFPIARQVLSLYDDKLQLIGPNQSILPNIESVAALGHTVGHLAFRFSSQDQSALLWADLVHNAGIQFAKPEWEVTVDTVPEAAVQSRHRLFAEAADQNYLIGGAHLPHPGLGHVSSQDNHCTWHPLSQ